MKNLSSQHYDYANQIVTILGFTGLNDYTSGFKISLLNEVHRQKINETIPEFKKLFLQRDFNLSRFGDKLLTNEQTLGFIKKLLTILDISFEIFRNKNCNWLRLKSQNIILQKYIMDISKMSTCCPQELPSVPKPEVHIDSLFSQYKVGLKQEKTVYFSDFIVLQNVFNQKNVFITSVKSDSKIKILFGGVLFLQENTPLKIPLDLIVYHDFKILSETNETTETTLTIEYYNHNEFPVSFKNYIVSFVPDNYIIENGILKQIQPFGILDQKTIDLIIGGNIEKELLITDIIIPYYDNKTLKIATHPKIDGILLLAQIKLDGVLKKSQIQLSYYEINDNLYTCYYPLDEFDIVYQVDHATDLLSIQHGTYCKVIKSREILFPRISTRPGEIAHIVVTIKNKKDIPSKINITGLYLQTIHRRMLAQTGDARIINFFK